MTRTAHRILDSDAPQKLALARHIMRPGGWSNQAGTVCMMSALVPGATSSFDCQKAGYPRWLTTAITDLYDAKVARGAPNSPEMLETERANEWAIKMAAILAAPTHLDRALDNFLIRVLARLQHIDPTSWCQTVRDLRKRGLAGTDVQKDLMVAACRAAEGSQPVSQAPQGPFDPEEIRRRTANAAANAAESNAVNACAAVCASEATQAWGAARGEHAALWERWLQRLDLAAALKDSALPS